MRALIDTNVLIDYLGNRQPFCTAWEKLNAMQMLGDLELWATPQSFADSFYILKGHIPSEDLQKSFLECLEFINVCGVGRAEITEACKQSWTDYEDSLIGVCAEKVKADYLLTRDKGGFDALKIPSFSPEGFFEMLETDYGLIYEMA